MYSNGIMGLNAPVIGQNDVYPGSNQSASEYATSAQTPVSSSAINAGYEPRTDAYSGQMMASGGIASIRRFEEGGPTQGNFDDSGRYVEAKPTYSNDDNGNLVDASGTVVATKEARDDPYINPIASDPTEIQSLFDLKTSDPKQFYSTVADKLNSVMTEKYQTNSNYDNEYNQLQKIKEIDPAAYYKNELGFKAHQMGWQVGQNRGERNTANQEAIKSMIPEAQKAGLSTDQIDSIVNQNFGQARNRNVQRIASELEAGGSGFSFQKDVQPMWPVLAAALTAGATAAYAPAAGAAAGAAETGIAASGALTPAEILAGAGGAYTPVAGGASFTLPTAAAETAGGITALDAGTQATNLASNAPNAATHGLDFGSNFTWNLPSTGMTTMQKLALGSLAAKGLTSGSGGSSGGAPTQTSSQNTAQATPAPVVQAPMPYAFPTYSPNQSYPGMNYSPTPYAQPMLYRYAQGGIAGLDSGDLGSYSDGGRLLKGGGTGLSDDIPATIGGNQPARLADGEFVVSSDVVSALGGGSTDSGAKKLYAMMDRIRKNAHGTKRQIRAINDKKVLPA